MLRFLELFLAHRKFVISMNYVSEVGTGFYRKVKSFLIRW